MSEVKRWKLKGFLPGVEGECKAVFQPTVVMAEDFDNATRLFLDAAERCVASERREKELQQRLNAADERADLLEGLLRELIDADSVLAQWTSNEVADDAENAYQNAFEKLKAALKPAEGGGDE